MENVFEQKIQNLSTDKYQDALYTPVRTSVVFFDIPGVVLVCLNVLRMRILNWTFHYSSKIHFGEWWFIICPFLFV